ncbi:MAG: hypothetical protein ABIS29_08990 [Vicinamibacterales bacterium]
MIERRKGYRVDHTSEVEVRALFRRIMRAHKRVDVVIDSVAKALRAQKICQ